MITPVHVPPPAPPSARARELGEQIALFVRDYRAENDDVTEVDIDQALTLARAQLCGSGAPRVMIKLMLAFGVGVAALILGLFFCMQRGGGGGPQGPMVMMIVIGVVIALLGVVAAAKAGSRH